MVLRARVTVPRALTLGQIKAVVDGIVAAAQWTQAVDQCGVDRLVEHLARSGVSASRTRLAELLENPYGARAGLCRDGLIAKDGRVDPDDHLVVAGAVEVKPESSSNVSVSAALFAAKRS